LFLFFITPLNPELQTNIILFCFQRIIYPPKKHPPFSHQGTKSQKAAIKRYYKTRFPERLPKKPSDRSDAGPGFPDPSWTKTNKIYLDGLVKSFL